MNNKKGMGYVISSNNINQEMIIIELRKLKNQIRDFHKNSLEKTKNLEDRIKKLEENLIILNLEFAKLQKLIPEKHPAYCNQYYSMLPKKLLH